MSWEDDLTKRALEFERMLKPLHEFGRHYELQRVVEEQLQRERFVIPSLGEMASEYSRAIEAIDTSIWQKAQMESHSKALEQLAGTHGALAQYFASQQSIGAIAQAQASLEAGWRKQIAAYQEPGPLQAYAAELALKAHSAAIVETGFLAQERLSRVPWEYLHDTTQLKAHDLSAARASFTILSEHYSELMRSFGNREDLITMVPPIVSSGPPVEVFTNAGVLAALFRPIKQAKSSDFEIEASSDIENEVEASLDDLLSALNSDFRRLLQGARDALGSDNPDRARHITSSLRELFTHVLHTMAPDLEVKEWSSDPTHFHDGRPTRAARVLYVCRRINHGPFAQFMGTDVKASLDLINMFQRGTHEVASGFTSGQLRLLVVRTESLLRFLLLTHRASE